MNSHLQQFLQSTDILHSIESDNPCYFQMLWPFSIPNFSGLLHFQLYSIYCIKNKAVD